MDDTSLKNEMNNFNIITKRIISKMQKLNQTTEFFYPEFQKIFLEQIDILKNLESNTPNYLFTAYVLNAKVEIYSYLQSKCIKLFTSKIDYEIVDILNDINQLMKKNQIASIELIKKISSNFEETLAQYKKDEQAKSDIINQQEQKITMLNSNLKTKELYASQLMEENRNLNEKISQYEMKNELNLKSNLNPKQQLQRDKDNVTKFQPKQQNPQNYLINPQLLPNNNNNSKNQLISQSDKQIKKIEVIPNTPKSIQSSNISSISQMIHPSNLNSQKKDRSLIGPITQRSLSLTTLLETINEIYQSKIQSDKKLNDSHQQKETLEQHMYTFLNHKYGLKNLVVEYAFAIINGIKKFSKENSEVCLFGKILRNEIEEGQVIIVSKIKQMINSYMMYYLQNKFSLKSKGEIEQIFNKIKRGNLSEEEWRNIVQYLFPNENDNMNLMDKIEKFINKVNQSTKANEMQISYQKFIQIVIEFQIRLRDNYLKNFNIMFKDADSDCNGVLNEEEFYGLLEKMGLYEKEECLQRFRDFVNKIDTFHSGFILYSDIINLLSKELIFEEDPETGEMIKMSILDKISIQFEE